MWKCEKCSKKFKENVMAVDVRFGYVDSEEAKERKDQYNAFQTEQSWGPLCDNCAIEYIKTGE